MSYQRKNKPHRKTKQQRTADRRRGRIYALRSHKAILSVHKVRGSERLLLNERLDYWPETGAWRDRATGQSGWMDDPFRDLWWVYRKLYRKLSDIELETAFPGLKKPESRRTPQPPLTESGESSRGKPRAASDGQPAASPLAGQDAERKNNPLLGYDGLLTMEQAGIGCRSPLTRKGKPEPEMRPRTGATSALGKLAPMPAPNVVTTGAYGPRGS